MNLLIVKWPNKTFTLIPTPNMNKKTIFWRVDSVGDPSDPETDIRKVSQKALDITEFKLDSDPTYPDDMEYMLESLWEESSPKIDLGF